jgi:hypothetical protein
MDIEVAWLVTSSSYQYVVSYRDGMRVHKYVARDRKTINIDGMIESHRKLVVGPTTALREIIDDRRS